MSDTLWDRLVQRRVEGRPDLKVLGFGFARKVDEYQREAASRALQRIDARQGEDVTLWATQLAANFARRRD